MRHLVISDTQCKPNQCNEHLRWLGEYIVAMQPDKIIHIGDHWDMESLSTYEKKGSMGMEGKRYNNDIKAGRDGMDALLKPLRDYRQKQRDQKHKLYSPEMHFCMGNHEGRIERAVNNDPKVEGLISYADLGLERDGWQVHDYLQPLVLDGIAYCHYFVSGVMGRPVSSARALLTKHHMSCVMGHVQQRDIAFSRRADGKQMTGIFTGIYYQHDEAYLNPQTNDVWRGVWVLNDVDDGAFDEMPISMNYLRRKYGQVKPIRIAA